MPPSLIVLAPVAGTVLAMTDVADPVFAGAIVGPGLASTRTARREHRRVAGGRDDHQAAPARLRAAGRRRSRGPRAPGTGHVQLAGAGFTLHVSEGDEVAAGDQVVSWDPDAVEAGGRSPVCPVVALEGAAAIGARSRPPGCADRRRRTPARVGLRTTATGPRGQDLARLLDGPRAGLLLDLDGTWSTASRSIGRPTPSTSPDAAGRSRTASSSSSRVAVPPRSSPPSRAVGGADPTS